MSGARRWMTSLLIVGWPPLAGYYLGLNASGSSLAIAILISAVYVWVGSEAQSDVPE